MNDFNWVAAIELEPSSNRSIYQQIADAIAALIRSGAVEADTKLPPQRKLAAALEVNVTTVARAYTELQQRNLVVGGVGSGTYVSGASAPAGPAMSAVPVQSSTEKGVIDLSINRPVNQQYLLHYAQALQQLQDDPRFSEIEDYLPPNGASWARQAGCRWLAYSGLQPTPEQVVITSGAQQGLFAVLSAITRPGDVIATNRITYYGLKSLAALLHLDIVAIDVDDQGLLPESLDKACQRRQVKVLFTVPTLHNPTTVTVPEARRQQIADVARHHELYVIEDDVYSPLLDKPRRPLCLYYPERSFYVGGTSKSLAPGLRIGFVVPPEEHQMQVVDALRTTFWMAAPINQLVFSRWVEDGTAFELAAQTRNELKARNAIASQALSGYDVLWDPCSTHLWLTLPSPWRATEFTAHAQHLGVRMLPSDVFAVGRTEVPHAVRINLGAARSREELIVGLGRVVTLLKQQPQNIFGAV